MLVPLTLLCLMVQAPWEALRGMMRELPSFLGVFSDTAVWATKDAASAPTWLRFALFALAIAASAMFFSLVALICIPLGQLLGWYLERAPRGILAYSVNVMASLCGILLFTAVCFLNWPPWVWLALAVVPLLVLVWPRPAVRLRVLVISLVCVCLLGVFRKERGAIVVWSPYQKLSVRPFAPHGEIVKFLLSTNNTWYQQILNLSPQFVASHPEMYADGPLEHNAYNLPYAFYPYPDSVLVLGAGMGNDVAAALRHNAREVVAVEIDPVVLELGKKYHFERPYQDPRVQTVTDDARSYIERCDRKFDLINFSLLDSHTTASQFTHVRLDNYVYTVEALRRARQLLAPDGLFVVKFQVEVPWIAARLHGLLTEVFGEPPLQFQSAGKGARSSTPGRFFVAGSQDLIAGAMASADLGAFLEQQQLKSTEHATLTTDDWPFFYQREPGLPMGILVISVTLLVLCGVALRQADLGPGPGKVRWHFFFLGAGFMLLEAQIISTMALLFGTTWVVNSLVIAGILILIVGANAVVARWSNLPATAAYAGLLLALLVCYLVPRELLFLESWWLRGIVSTLLLCSPIFFASIIFISSFSRAGFAGGALGFNLLGALCGGMLEGVALWIGLKALLIVSAVLYLASWIWLQRPAGSEDSLAAAPARSPKSC